MSRVIDESAVRHIAHLSRLALTDAQIAAMAAELSKIVGYIDQMSALDTSNVEPTAHPLAVRNVFRSDTVAESLDPERALSNAPQREQTFFKVPKVLETEEGA